MNGAEDIESEIERTRSEMTDTLQAIKQKFSPNRLLDEAMETMRSASLNQSRVMELVRDNPVPLALVGVGVGWLVLSSVRRPRTTAEFAEEYAEEGASAMGGEQAEEWGGDGGQRQSEAAGETASSLPSQARRLAQRMNRVTHIVRRRAGDVADSTGDLFQQHPLTIGLLAVAAGVALGAAIPRTRQEVEILGGTSGELLGSARESGRDVLQRAGRVAQRAAETISEAGAAKFGGTAGSMTTH